MEKPDLREILKRVEERLKAFFSSAKDFPFSFQKRSFSKRELMVLFVSAVLIGAMAKSNVHDSFTIGFDDYRVTKSERVLDLNVLQKELIQKGGTLAVAASEAPQGEVCAE